MTTPRRHKPRGPHLAVHGAMWLSIDGESLGGHGRMQLLRAVASHGSITRAARAFGMSYKAAWQAIDTMNARTGRPLVERVTGGRGGGSTRLTAHGERLLERYEQVGAVHQRFLHLLERGAMDLDEEFSMLKVLNVKTSARNQWLGTVAAIRPGAVNDEVEIALPGDTRLIAIITRESTGALGLRLQQTVIAMVKAPAVMLAIGLDEARVSARNRLEGSVARITPGAVNAEVAIDSGGLPVIAIVTQASVEALDLKPGVKVSVLVQASDIVLGTVS